jgi:hypothetical protein
MALPVSYVVGVGGVADIFAVSDVGGVTRVVGYSAYLAYVSAYRCAQDRRRGGATPS